MALVSPTAGSVKITRIPAPDPHGPFEDPGAVALFFHGAPVTGGSVPGGTCQLLVPPPGSGLDTGLGCFLDPRLEAGDTTTIDVQLMEPPAAGKEALVFPFVPRMSTAAPFLLDVPAFIPAPGGSPFPSPSPVPDPGPPAIGNIFTDPDPVIAGDPAHVHADFFGASPFQATVHWGAGAQDTTLVDLAGSGGGRPHTFFSAAHTYAADGTFPVVIDVLDPSGRSAEAQVLMHVLQRQCAEAPSATLISGEGQYNLQVKGACAAMLAAGAAKARVRILTAGQTITAWDVHAPDTSQCSVPQPFTQITCDLKPDGRVCFHLDVEPPPAEGQQVEITLLDKDGNPLASQTFTVTIGAVSPACPTTG